MDILCGKRFTFESAHYIKDHPTCGQLHGHTWTLDVEITGQIDPETGMLIDFKELGRMVKKVTDLLDHKTINMIVGFAPVTAETLVHWIWQQIRLQFPIELFNRIDLLACKLQEGPGGWAQYAENLGGWDGQR